MQEVATKTKAGKNSEPKEKLTKKQKELFAAIRNAQAISRQLKAEGKTIPKFKRAYANYYERDL